MKWLLALLLTGFLLLTVQHAFGKISGFKNIESISQANVTKLQEASEKCRDNKQYEADLQAMEVNFVSDNRSDSMIPVGVVGQGKKSELQFVGGGDFHKRTLYKDDGQTYYQGKNGQNWIVNIKDASPSKVVKNHDKPKIKQANYQGSSTCWFAQTFEQAMAHPKQQAAPVQQKASGAAQ